MAGAVPAVVKVVVDVVFVFAADEEGVEEEDTAAGSLATLVVAGRKRWPQLQHRGGTFITVHDAVNALAPATVGLRAAAAGGAGGGIGAAPPRRPLAAINAVGGEATVGTPYSSALVPAEDDPAAEEAGTDEVAVVVVAVVEDALRCGGATNDGAFGRLSAPSSSWLPPAAADAPFTIRLHPQLVNVRPFQSAPLLLPRHPPLPHPPLPLFAASASAEASAAALALGGVLRHRCSRLLRYC